MSTPETELARWFAGIGRELHAQPNVEDTLRQACRLAVASVDGCTSAGVTLVERGGRLETRQQLRDLAERVVNNENGHRPRTPRT